MNIPRHHAYVVWGDAASADAALSAIASAWDVELSSCEVLKHVVGLARVTDGEWVKQEASLSPSTSGLRIVVLVASAFPEELQNALLKTLEEPAARVVVVLVLPQGVTLLPTVLSRVLSLTVEVGFSVWKASDFLSASYPNRFSMIAAWKAELEDDSDSFRTNARALVLGMQTYYAQLITRQPVLAARADVVAIIQDLEFITSALNVRGAPVGQLLDQAAMAVPEALPVLK